MIIIIKKTKTKKHTHTTAKNTNLVTGNIECTDQIKNNE